jgi:hypothetical protein
MKGKRIDRDFLNSFMNECLNNGISSSQDMARIAKEKIDLIDVRIKEIENLKNIRCKLLDVVSSFDNKEKHVSGKDQKTLLFYKITNIGISKNICKMLIDNNDELPLKILENNIKKPKHDVYFCVKQMIDIGILNRHDDFLKKGNLFNEYFAFVGKR